jgi:integrase
MKINQSNLAKLKLLPGKNEAIFFDEDLAGFGVRVRAGGKRTWIVQYRLGSKQRRLTLGSLATKNEKDARKLARTALSKVHLGHDPQMEKLERRAQAGVTLGSIVEPYLLRAETSLKPRSFLEVKRHLHQHWAPLSEKPLANIARADVAARLAIVSRENGPFAANRARSSLSAMFSWAIAEGLADGNPVAGTNKATDEISRDRVLSPDELRLVWSNAGPGDYGAIVRILILTGQRREEVGGMLWSELDLDKNLWSIGAERTKNSLPHDVPLSAEAVATLKGLQRRPDRDLVFGTSAGPFQGWSNAKTTLDERIEKSVLKETGQGAKLKPWRLHDIRRTVATPLGDQGTLPHVIEAILNHISGHRAGVAGVYNRSAYAAEKRAALDAWATVVGDLEKAKPSAQ